jgi:opacity protein-like surface antigen
VKANSFVLALTLASLPVFGGTSAPVVADETANATSENPPWFVRTALYGWAQGLDGDIAVRGRSVPVDVGFDDILENLDIAAMGAIEIGRGRWSLMADLNYAKIGSSKDAGGASLDVENKQFLGNFSLIFEAVATDRTHLDLYAGARVNWIDLQLDIDGGGPFGAEFHRSHEKAWVDPVVGAHFQADLSGAFFFRSVGDIGGFGIASDITWQAMAGIGWRASENGSLLAGYRAIGTDYTDGGFTYDVVAHGPILGFEYKF